MPSVTTAASASDTPLPGLDGVIRAASVGKLIDTTCANVWKVFPPSTSEAEREKLFSYRGNLYPSVSMFGGFCWTGPVESCAKLRPKGFDQLRAFQRSLEPGNLRAGLRVVSTTEGEHTRYEQRCRGG